MRERGDVDAVVAWVDSHCHLQGEYGEQTGELDGVLARAGEAGVTTMVCVGTDARTSEEAVSLARALGEPGSPAAVDGITVRATVGLHPHEASAGVDGVVAVLDRATAGAGGNGAGTGAGDLVVAVGECGLDYHYDHAPRDAQRQAFAAQVELAAGRDLALVIHTREAWDDTFAILAEVGVPGRTVFHCFTGGPAEARRALDIGAYVSFSGIVTFRNADDVRQAAQLCPLDRILVETDAPFLTPVPHRGAPNEPSFVPLVGAAVAVTKGLPVAEVAAATTANAAAAFRI